MPDVAGGRVKHLEGTSLRDEYVELRDTGAQDRIQQEIAVQMHLDTQLPLSPDDFKRPAGC